MVPKGLKPQECERVKLCEPPPVPYVPKKDKVQDEVARMRSVEIKTTIKKDTTLNFAVWEKNGTHEAFLMHVTAVINAIKKCGHFEDYEKAAYAYEKAKKAIESARAGLSLLEEGGEIPRKSRKKKSKEGEKEAPAKVPDPKAPDPKAPAKAPEQGQTLKETEVAPAAKDDMKASFLSDLRRLSKPRRLQRVRWTLLQVRCSCSTQTCFLPEQVGVE